ncbi:MAG: hypothetical protein AB1416_04700 [Actinomycetota bacterium]
MNAITVRNEIIKWVVALVACFAIAIALYLGAAVQVYLLGWIIELIGIIFT